LSGRCLGTRILGAVDDDRPRAFLLSDLHLTRDGGPALDALRRVLAAARQRAAETRVVLLGDLFDVYVTAAQLRMPRWDEVVGALRHSVDAGVAVSVLHGNRDFLLGARFARASGCRVVAGGLRIRLGGREVVCLHGDELCLRDLGYQRAKRLLRSAPVRGLARLLPARLVLGAGRRARARSAVQVRALDASRTDVAAAGVDRAFAATGASALVCGHVHRAAHHPAWPGGGELWILPAFDEGGVHLRHEAGRFATVDADGRAVPDFPPRPLS
jgi:UDP-2,3-diacylglucosamine hydrolase